MNDISIINTALTTIPEDWKSASLVDIRSNKRMFPRLHEYRSDVAVANMGMIVTQAYILRGQVIDTRHIEFIASHLVSSLMREENWGCRNITFEEIRRCIHNGVLEQDIILNVPTLYRMILGYAKTEGHEAQKRATNRAKVDA